MLLSEQKQKKTHSTSLPHSLEHQVTLSNQSNVQSQAFKSRKCPLQSFPVLHQVIGCEWVIDRQTGWLRSERVPTRLTWFAGVTDTVRVRTYCDWLRLITWCQNKLSEKSDSCVWCDQWQKRTEMYKEVQQEETGSSHWGKRLKHI